MVFEINGKIALVTGGASGIGLQIVKDLLRNGVGGVTFVDVNLEGAQTVLAEIEKEFGSNRILFVEADVADIEQFENAFKKTIETFKHVDILINNAGICNDKAWQKEIAVNFVGPINGILLGLENYLPKYKQGSEVVIVNISSIFGVGVYPCTPIYSATKAGVIALTRSWGNSHHYERTKVRLFAVCPGFTLTPILTNIKKLTLGEGYENWMNGRSNTFVPQEANHVAQEVRKLLQSCPNGTTWIVEEKKPAYQYVNPEREAMQK